MRDARRVSPPVCDVRFGKGRNPQSRRGEDSFGTALVMFVVDVLRFPETRMAVSPERILAA
ncbi:MAG: hypothetical protein DBY37_00145 [Desulfovibrionaceae bacterium]|nr:MAG: hypothetical protein DBY37_00145 [Desulfovibrionaceae bacterium]